MRKGDKLPVAIEGAIVGYGEIEHVGEETVTIFVPAMRVVAKKRVQLDLSAQERTESGSVLITDEGGTPQGTSEAVESPVTASNTTAVEVPASAPVETTEAVSEPVAPTVEPSTDE